MNQANAHTACKCNFSYNLRLSLAPCQRHLESHLVLVLLGFASGCACPRLLFFLCLIRHRHVLPETFPFCDIFACFFVLVCWAHRVAWHHHDKMRCLRTLNPTTSLAHLVNIMHLHPLAACWSCRLLCFRSRFGRLPRPGVALLGQNFHNLLLYFLEGEGQNI